MPFIASWKGHVPFASACEEPVVGYDLFRDDMAALSAALTAAGVPHTCANDRRYLHRWDSGWLSAHLPVFVGGIGGEEGGGR